MKLSLEPYLDQEALEESADEDFCASFSSTPTKLKKNTPFVDINKIISEEKCKADELLKKIKKQTAEKKLNKATLHRRALNFLKKNPIPSETSEPQRIRFGDTFFLTVGDELVKAEPQTSALDLHLPVDPVAALSLKHAVTRQLEELLTKHKNANLNSISKSRLDWRAFSKRQRIDAELQYHRKDDILLQTFLLNR